ncbi:MAG: hypothetical protein IPK98_11060 [Chloracidobacterium sp.]|nr:hypothetical protein [Chloracidobacterium sp.]
MHKLRSSFVLVCLSLSFTATFFGQRQTGPLPTSSPTPAGDSTRVTTPAASPTPAPTPPPPPDPMGTQAFGGLRFRSIGPAVTSGRVLAFAVDPNDRTKYYVAVASGGVWKTVNPGTTWTSVFDNEGAFSIGAIALDQKIRRPSGSGTGERNSQRSVGYGDGVYRSDDGGRSWRNVGLKTSEHIGRIAIDPRDSNVVFVAARALWAPGGERGLYKTTDGGKTWKAVIPGTEHTGVTDVAIDPANPDTMYAATWQRRRHFYTLINGGPECDTQIDRRRQSPDAASLRSASGRSWSHRIVHLAC